MVGVGSKAVRGGMWWSVPGVADAEGGMVVIC